jgi:hypothetical protein
MATCDIECQRAKELKKLSSDMVTAAQNKAKDPEGYEKARQAYYTVKEGQGWLSQEKEKKANEDVQPILDSFQKKFDDMKDAMKYQSALEQAKQDLLNSEVGDESEIKYVHAEVQKEKDQADVYRRSKELQDLPMNVYSWLPTFLDLVLGILILYIVFQIFVQGKLTVSQSTT